MNFVRAFKFLKYSLFSRYKTGYGIHSPFVFDLVTRVFRNKTDMSIVFKVEAIRKRLLSDKRKIVVEDFGSGSKKMKSNLRKVSDLTKYSTVPQKYGTFLSKMSIEFGSPSIVELGTSVGISTIYLALGNPQSKVFTIEGATEISKTATTYFVEGGIKNVTSLTGTFEDLLPKVLIEVKEPGLVFIDGNHRKEPVMNYFYQVAEVSGENTVVIIDDIYNSREMEEAWIDIKQHEKVSVTVDIFRMGIVFFRKGMTRQDFIIRY